MTNTKPKLTTSWIVTLIPLIMYLISAGFTLVTGMDLTEQQFEILEGLLTTVMITSGVGGALGIVKKLKATPGTSTSG